MSYRERHYDNALWVFCCCGCSPIFGLIKGCLNVGFAAVFFTVPCFILSIVLLPHDIYYTYKTVIQTRQLGRNLTILAMLLLPVPLMLWPFVVLLGSLIFSVLYGLFRPVYDSFESNDWLLISGFAETYKNLTKYIQEFYVFNCNSYFVYLEEYRVRPLAPGGVPLDISLTQVVVALGVAFCGVLFDGILILLMSLLKYIPALIRIYYIVWYAYIDMFQADVCCAITLFLPFCMLNVVMAPLSVLTLLLVIIGGFVVGLGSAYQSYNKGARYAFAWMFRKVRDFDTETNEFIFNMKTTSCCCNCCASSGFPGNVV
jgi:hypothetical protein